MLCNQLLQWYEKHLNLLVNFALFIYATLAFQLTWLFLLSSCSIISLASPLLGKALQKLLSERFHITNNAPDTYLRFKDGAVQLQKKSLLKNVRFACASINNTKEDQKTALRLQVEDDGKSLRISCTSTGIAGIDEHAVVKKYSLGPDVCIQKLEVQPSQILLDGHFLVRP